MTESDDRLERSLDPDVVGPLLFTATMFVTTFEILKNSVIDRIRSFYTDGFNESGPTVSPEYQKKVASLNKSILYASLKWLQENDVISATDLEDFEELKKTRNKLAHRLFEVVTSQEESAHEMQFDLLVRLLKKIEVWWVINIEIPSNPDFDGQEIDEKGIVPGSILALQMLLQVASGNTELLEHWRKHRPRSEPNV